MPPRIRSMKPEAFQHPKVGRLSDAAFRLWCAMLHWADDAGRIVADTGHLRLIAFGYQDDVTTAKVAASLQEVAETGLIVLYTVNTAQYAYFPSWKEHQRLDHPYPSKLPPPPNLRSTNARRTRRERSENAPGALRPDLDLEGKGSGSGGDRRGSTTPRLLRRSRPVAPLESEDSDTSDLQEHFDHAWAAFSKRASKGAGTKSDAWAAWLTLRPTAEEAAAMIRVLRETADDERFYDHTGAVVVTPALWLETWRESQAQGHGNPLDLLT